MVFPDQFKILLTWFFNLFNLFPTEGIFKEVKTVNFPNTEFNLLLRIVKNFNTIVVNL